MAQRATDPAAAAHVAADSAAHPPEGRRADERDEQARARALDPSLSRGADPADDMHAHEHASRWERLFDAITDPIGVVNADSRLVYANAAYRALFDRVPDGVIGHECFSAHPNPSGGPCETCPVPAAIRGRRPAFVQTERPARGGDLTSRPPLPSGEGEAPAATRVFQRWTYPVIEPDGSIHEVVEMIKDVTEQERLREVSRQAEALRVADRLKAELLGTVSHELRSPLASIKGYAGTLLRYDGRLPRSERHEFLTAISQASDRLEAIIDQLLLMSQLETGLISLNRAPVDLRQLAHEAVTGIERRLPYTAYDESEIPVAPNAPEAVARHRFVVVDHTGSADQSGSGVWTRGITLGDRRLLRQALDEVLDNAVKYSPDGGLIEVSLRRAAPARGTPEPEGASTGAMAMLELCVRDEGLGIPNEHLGQIFDRFHRVEVGLTSAFGGLGLGLAICKRVIELHGGSVRVESEPGKGTEFCLLLPESDLGSLGDQSPDPHRDGTAVSNPATPARMVALGEDG